MPLLPAIVSIPENSRILVAVSGGLDSVVLLHALYLQGAKIGVAHCNFGLRGSESDGDESFVKSLADKYRIPFYCTHFSTLQHAEANGISMQMAARDLRYAWFEQIRTENKFDFIATAHHLNDSAETALLNLIRGTGPAGLRGIPENSGTLLRPLITTTRKEIVAYAKQYNLSWRDDSSNASDYYKRNFLRHKVIPLLEELNPNFLQTQQQNQQRMADAVAIIEEKAAEVKNHAVTELPHQTWIKTGLLPKNGLPLLLHELIKQYNFSYLQATDISKNINRHSGKHYFSPTHRLLIDRQQLIISPLIKELENPEYYIESQTTELNFGNHKLLLNHLKPEDYQLKKSADLAALDSDKLTFPLTLRKWQPGDRFQPFGMRGQKKVSDFLIDQKIPVSEKENVWVLLSREEIVWLVGFRMSDKFKITSETRNILELRMLKK